MMEEKPKILFVPITAQPPTFGMIMSIMYMEDGFDEIIICVQDNPIVIKTEVVLKMLGHVFKEPKYKIITSECDFTTISEVPDNLPHFNYLGLISDRAYANLLAKGYRCFLLPKTIGYDELFHRLAFRQSQQLELLRMKMSVVSFNNLKNSTPNGEDGE